MLILLEIPHKNGIILSQMVVQAPGGGGGGYSDMFRKMNIFLGYEDFVDIFGGSSQNWASLRVISRSRYRFGIFFWVAKISNIFWGCLKFLICFLGER